MSSTARRRSLSLVACLLLLAYLAPARAAAQSSTGLVATARGLFEFHSGVWVNLHHFLYVQARARRGFPDSRRSAVAAAPGDTVGFGALPEATRRDWESALAYYERVLAGRDVLFDRGMNGIRNWLDEMEGSSTLEEVDRSASAVGPALDPELVVALMRAAPAYRALWWPRHDAANRAWVKAMLPLLDARGEEVAREAAAAFRSHWPAAPIRVDVVAYANWAGAYTTNDPSRITLTSLDSSYRGLAGLEMLFHESLHTMEDSVDAALERAGRARGKRVPRDLVHAIIFFTPGEIVRRREREYTPYPEKLGIWMREPWPRYLELLRAHWLPYLEGRASFEQAIDTLIAAL